MMNIDEDMVSSDSLSGNSPPIYLRSILEERFFYHGSNILNNTKDIVVEKTGSRRLGISHIDDGTLFSFLTEKVMLLICGACKYVQNPIKHNMS